MTVAPRNSGNSSEAVLAAAQWLAEQVPPPRLAVPALKERFSLSALQACEAIAMADRFRVLRKAHA
ncbi:hypothetical protein OCK02_19310 [Rhizobium sp. TRM96647]|nr:hypothetical protein [Rhizobium sp. TRM96647]MCV3759893.1 hypothetical protein [Rhizobium sp. TRM96650]